MAQNVLMTSGGGVIATDLDVEYGPTGGVRFMVSCGSEVGQRLIHEQVEGERFYLAVEDGGRYRAYAMLDYSISRASVPEDDKRLLATFTDARADFDGHVRHCLDVHEATSGLTRSES